MMHAEKIEKLPGSMVKLTFSVSPEDAKPYIDEALSAMQTAKPVPGFRPGKAPYAEAVKQYGEMRILENALERIVRAAYVRAILDNELDTVGSPAIDVTKLVPGAAIEFTVTAPLAPSAEKLASYDKPLAEFKPRAIADADVDKAVEDLRRMQRKEVISANPAGKEDLVVVDLEMKRDHVVLEGGTAQGYRVYLAEDQYIPGFSSALVGISKGEERTFSLPFPKEHFQKHLAGKDVDFTAKAKEVYTIELPALDDAFAKSLGQKDVATLRELIKRNLTLEEEGRAKESAEIQLLEKLVDGSTFTDIPDLLVNEEVLKMLRELETSVEERGGRMEDYLASIKKTKDELKLEIVPQAVRRIKTATLIKDVAKREKITVSDEELDAEIDRILEGVKPGDRETRERVVSPEYREYVALLMRNHKTIELLRKKAVSGWPEESHESGVTGHEHVHDENCHHEH